MMCLSEFQREASCLCTISPKKHQDTTSAPQETRSALLPATSPFQSCHVRETLSLQLFHLQSELSIPSKSIRTTMLCFNCSSPNLFSFNPAASMNIGSTAGIIGGVVAGLIALIVIIYCCCCRKKKKDDEYAMG